MPRIVSLLLTPTGTAENDPPEIYIDAGGVWRIPGELSLPPRMLPESRESFARTLGQLAEVLEQNPAHADDGGVRADGAELFGRLIGTDVRQVLRDAVAKAGSEPPVLRIHANHRYDWIPWELLYDDEEQYYLGLKFAIARLPMVANPPEMPSAAPRRVGNITSLLGDGIVSAADPDVATWRGTFAGLTNGANITLLPVDGVPAWPRIPDVEKGLRHDILHITSHGLRVGSDFFLNLSPNDPIPTMKALGPKQINVLKRTASAPLVFANACNPPGGAAGTRLEPSGLGKAFFMRGAVNIIATLAPVARPTALAFARRFYEKLLASDQPAIGVAMLETKKEFSTGQDPSYLFYALYGPPETHFAH